MKKLNLVARLTLLMGLFAGSGVLVHAQTYATGQVVYATPSGASNDWHSGCTIGAGRSNNSYQVVCDGMTWWVSRDHIRTTAPTAQPDPMRPGQMQVPVVTPPASAAKAAPVAVGKRVATAGKPTPEKPAAGGVGAVTTPQEVHARIAQDKVDAANAVLKVGKYSCYASGRYTFSDLFITGPHSYRVEPGGSGSYSYANGALTFSSGPYAGAYSRMVDGKTVGVSAKGNTNLGTQCGYEGK